MGRIGIFGGRVAAVSGIGVAMVLMVIPMGMVSRVIVRRVIRGLVTARRLSPVHRMAGMAAFHSRRQCRQAGNRQHQHPAKQSVKDPFHVGQTLVSKGVTPQ